MRHEDEAQLRKRLASLSELQQEVVYLRFVHDLRTKDIARHLGKSDGAIRMILSRALNLLRGIYNQQEEA
ncbi:sigma-70 family RNA polymerase sigma factor [Ktedonosporobacter rubrisoli]|uniref:RNA polymerase sigma factor n=1 Tax=Ktedonosporobacter rubrisoli TaxID=2509675 RepID=UPI0013EE7816